MKKKITLIISLLLVFTVACGREDDESKKSNNSNEGLVEKYEEKAEVEVADVKHYKWLDESIGNETITVYAEIKNTSNANIDAGRAKITYLDVNGGVIAVNDSQVSPRFIKKGGTGYLSEEIEGGIEKYKDLDTVEIEVSPEPFLDAEIVEFSTKNEKINVGTWGEKNAQISVTGFFENESDINFSGDDTSATIGLYDKDGNFLASQTMHQGQEFSLDANGETSFEVAGGWPLPPEIGEKVDYAEMKAIGIENMDDYWW